MIQISEAAANELKRIQRSRQQPDAYIRLGVKPGGCSGFYYTFDLSQALQEGDRVFTTQDLCVIVDPVSATYLEGLKLDYAEDLMGGGFRFNNPKASATCSCGLSFAYSS
jgi:iron-sulfur cluster assembly accessory protein